MKKVSLIFSRVALAASYLSAVADRFGLWGKAGTTGVFWGNFDAFLDYTHILNPWAPRALSNFLGYAVTGIEILLGLLFLIGLRLKETSAISFGLLLIFALSMGFTIGVKSALDYSVLSAAGASLLLLASYDEKETL